MRKHVGQVVWTDSELADRVGEHIWVGRGFALVDAGRLAPPERAWMEREYGPADRCRYAIPLGQTPIELPGMIVAADTLPPLRLSSVTCDRMLYRQGRDTVRLLLLDLAAPDSSRMLVISESGREFARRTVALDAAGVAAVELTDLAAGQYDVRWSDAEPDDSVCEFTVAEYRLAPLVASLVRRKVHGSSSLNAMLHLESFGVPVSGPVRLELLDRDRPVKSATTEAKQGRAYATFPLLGEGPHVINVQLLDDPSRTATVPIVGSREQDRRPTVFSQMGPVVAGALLPSENCGEVRGIYFSELGIQSSPVRLERVDGRTIRLRANTALEAPCVQVINPLAGQVCAPAVFQRGWAPAGETIEMEHPGALAFVAVAAFVEGRPWEGWAAVVAPSRLEPKIRLPEQIVPGEEVTVQVETNQDAGPVYLIVRDARLAAKETPASNLAGQIKEVVEKLGDLEPPAPRPACALRDPIGMLLHEGTISRDQLADAWALARQRNIRVVDALVRLEYATAEETLKAAAKAGQGEYVDLDDVAVPLSVIELIPELVARENTILPVAERGDVLIVAMSTAHDIALIEKLRFILNREIYAVLATRDSIQWAINQYYGQMESSSADSLLQEFTDTAIDFTESTEDVCPDAVVSTDIPQPLSAVGPTDEADVLLARLLPTCGGHAQATFRLGNGVRDYVAEAFVVGRRPEAQEWGAAEARFRAERDPYAELQLPAYVCAGDGAEGHLHVGARSGRLRARVTRNGRDVPLRHDGRVVSPGEVLSIERGSLQLLAAAGDYQATVENVDTGQVARTAGRVGLPGKMRRLARPLRFLEPGEEVARQDQPAVQSLRVLPGLERQFGRLVEATGGYEHCCCEQTAAKLVAAALMYATSPDDAARRQRAEEMLLAGVRRQQSMWLPGRGFKSYPGPPEEPDLYWGKFAARYLHYLQLLRDMPGKLGGSLAEAVEQALTMALDTASAYDLAGSHGAISAADVYHAVRFGSSPTVRQQGMQWLRRHLTRDGQRLDHGRFLVRGAVQTRTEAAYAAAALLRDGNTSDLPAAIRLANQVLQSLGPDGRLYSTADSVAAIALMSELQLARVLNSGGPVAVNGRELSAAEAAEVPEVDRVRATHGRVVVEITRLVEEDWRSFAGLVGLHVALNKDGRHTTSLQLADAVQLVVTVQDGYREGDLLWVCLPDSLSRLLGGGQVKQFSVDFQGQDTVRVPLAATGVTLDDRGRPAPHHFAVCLRNMYEEERVGNPGLLEVTVHGPEDTAVVRRLSL